MSFQLHIQLSLTQATGVSEEPVKSSTRNQPRRYIVGHSRHAQSKYRRNSHEAFQPSLGEIWFSWASTPGVIAMAGFLCGAPSLSVRSKSVIPNSTSLLNKQCYFPFRFQRSLTNEPKLLCFEDERRLLPKNNFITTSTDDGRLYCNMYRITNMYVFGQSTLTISDPHSPTLSTSETLDKEKGSFDVDFSSTSTETIGIDPIAEKRLLRKLDSILLPIGGLIYCLNVIDRTAIGNARVAGLEDDLGLQGYDYNIALTIFYIFYIAFEIPANLALKRFGSISIALFITLFGIVTISAAFVQNYNGLIATRVFLGIAEGGTLPGVAYILSRYYRRHELSFRIGIFSGTAPCVAGAFGGLLASGLLACPDIGSVVSWRKIFLIEGIITTGFGILGLWFIPTTDPQRSRMLNEDERELAIRRIDADRPIKTHGNTERTTWRLVWRSFNFNTTLCGLLFLLMNISFQGLSLFMPTVIAGLGHYTTVQVQLRTVPPYVAAGFWGLFVSYMGHKLRKRFVALLVTVPLVLIGYIIALATDTSNARYAACFLSVIGLIPAGPAIIAWGTENAAPDTMRATTTAIIPSLGTLGAIIAVWTYLPTDAPQYRNGTILNVATSTAAILLVSIGAFYINWENRKRDRGERNYRLEGKKSPQEILDLGYKHPDFRYHL